MGKHYHIDLEKYSLEKFKRNLKARDMIPSRVILKEDLDERFKILESNGISNLKELTERLKTRSKIEQFSEITGLSIQYLTVLNREAKSYLPAPVRLDKFSGIPAAYVSSLEQQGIKNTRQLFYAATGKRARELLSQKTRIPVQAVTELVCLSDLARIYGVGKVRG